MSLRIAHPEESKQWAKIIKKDPFSTFFDKYEWCQALGLISNRIKPLPLFLEYENQIIDIFPACIMKYKVSKGLESIAYSDYGGGPLFRRNVLENNHEIFLLFLKNLLNIGKQNNCLKISIRRSYHPKLIEDKMIDRPYFIENNACTFFITLQKGIDEIYKNFKESRKRSIRQSEKRGVTIRCAKNIEDLEKFYKVYCSTLLRLNSEPLPLHFFKHIWNIFALKNEAILFLAEHKGKTIGGIFLLIFNKTCHAWSGGSLSEYFKYRPMDALLWHSIKWSYENKLTIFDIGGSPNDPKSGQYFYKKSFDSKKRDLYNYHIILKPFNWKIYNIGKKITEKFQTLDVRAPMK